MKKSGELIRNAWKIIRILWVISGVSFFLWMIYSYQSRGFPDTILQSDPLITVLENSDHISFVPIKNRQSTGFIFYPGGMVDPNAYAPLARQIAENGFIAYIVKLPLRSAPLARHETNVMQSTRQIMDTNQSIQQWVLGGHSRGGAIASRFAYYNQDLLAGVILIGTSHPKNDEFDLSTSELNVMKIYATHDGLASMAEIKETSRLLPKNTIFIKIIGGNHSQFGYFGTALGDEYAEISREHQQEVTLSAILSLLNDIDK